MKISRRLIAWTSVVVCLGLLGAFGWSRWARNSVLPDDAWDKVAWRIQVLVRKAEGGMADLGWSELWHMMRRNGGFGLQKMVTEGRSVDGAVSNSYVSRDDQAAGARIFHEHCSACHGREGEGWHAPGLNRPGLKHGDSDLSIYKTLRDGISDSSMRPTALSLVERWQVTAYVRTLQLSGLPQEGEESAQITVNASPERIRSPRMSPGQWLTYSGSLDGWRYAPQDEITPSNVSRLRVRWIKQFNVDGNVRFEATPLVVDNVMFVTEPPSNIIAIDAKTGQPLWKYTRNVPSDLKVCCGRVNRGLAVLGKTLFLGSLDGYLVAVNAETGALVWQTQVASSSDGFTLTGAPLVVDGLVVVGVAGGEYAARGFLAAYDAATGRKEWKFNTIPGPGEPGHETWKNDAWKTGGGATWITGAYDPALGLIYWGVGNPAPDFQGDVRPGDNLYTNSVVALHADSGKLAWYFQFTPHDEHDWDSAQTPVLADLSIDGRIRKVICWANRNGFYYVLDRTTGEFLVGTPFVEQNWTAGLDAHGRPLPSPGTDVPIAGRLVRPGVTGGTNWQNPAFDDKRGLMFVPSTEGASVFTKSQKPQRGEQGIYVASAGASREPPAPVVRALDAATGTRKWEYFSAPPQEAGYGYGGLLVTGGGLVWGAAGGRLFAVDAENGREQWHVWLGGDTVAPPISFEVDGRQVVAILVGRTLLAFGL